MAGAAAALGQQSRLLRFDARGERARWGWEVDERNGGGALRCAWCVTFRASLRRPISHVARAWRSDLKAHQTAWVWVHRSSNHFLARWAASGLHPWARRSTQAPRLLLLGPITVSFSVHLASKKKFHNGVETRLCIIQQSLTNKIQRSHLINDRRVSFAT
jgi:hypothetical protein